jgi:hypothetical protein
METRMTFLLSLLKWQVVIYIGVGERISKDLDNMAVVKASRSHLDKAACSEPRWLARSTWKGLIWCGTIMSIGTANGTNNVATKWLAAACDN